MSNAFIVNFYILVNLFSYNQANMPRILSHYQCVCVVIWAGLNLGLAQNLDNQVPFLSSDPVASRSRFTFLCLTQVRSAQVLNLKLGTWVFFSLPGMKTHALSCLSYLVVTLFVSLSCLYFSLMPLYSLMQIANKTLVAFLVATSLLSSLFVVSNFFSLSILLYLYLTL